MYPQAEMSVPTTAVLLQGATAAQRDRLAQLYHGAPTTTAPRPGAVLARSFLAPVAELNRRAIPVSDTTIGQHPVTLVGRHTQAQSAGLKDTSTAPLLALRELRAMCL